MQQPRRMPVRCSFMSGKERPGTRVERDFFPNLVPYVRFLSHDASGNSSSRTITERVLATCCTFLTRKTTHTRSRTTSSFLFFFSCSDSVTEGTERRGKKALREREADHRKRKKTLSSVVLRHLACSQLFPGAQAFHGRRRTPKRVPFSPEKKTYSSLPVDHDTSQQSVSTVAADGRKPQHEQTSVQFCFADEGEDCPSGRQPRETTTMMTKTTNRYYEDETPDENLFSRFILRLSLSLIASSRCLSLSFLVLDLSLSLLH
jgi:hypothetical protein